MIHKSVLFEECMQALEPQRGGLFIDGTAGGGGHSEGLLKRGASQLICFDKDEYALSRCRERLKEYDVRFVHDDFKNARQRLSELGVEAVDGAILDLGVSSFQLDDAERGFSYSKNAPLDMRMDREAELSASTIVNGYTEERLKKLIYQYGEERFAPRIARAICAARPIEDTESLAEIIKEAIPAAARRSGGHPAKKTFQAIRIEVNTELSGLTDAVTDFIDVLAPGGRLAVISFHSLEDRAVKEAMRTAQNPCICPPDFPVCVCGRKPKGEMSPRKPIIPTAQECEDNPRARSAKLRIFIKKEEP